MDSKILHSWASKHSVKDASLDFEEGSVLIEKQTIEVDAPVNELASRQRIEWKRRINALWG